MYHNITTISCVQRKRGRRLLPRSVRGRRLLPRSVRPVAKKFFQVDVFSLCSQRLQDFWCGRLVSSQTVITMQFITVRPVAKNVFVWTSCFFTDRDSNVPRSLRPVAKNVLCGPVRRQRIKRTKSARERERERDRDVSPPSPQSKFLFSPDIGPTFSEGSSLTVSFLSSFQRNLRGCVPGM